MRMAWKIKTKFWLANQFDRNSTNPWDHDDFGDGEALANPNDPFTGPDAIDEDDDNDTREDLDLDHFEEGESCIDLRAPRFVSDWDSDNDCESIKMTNRLRSLL